MEFSSNNEPLFGRVNKLLNEDIAIRGSDNISQSELTKIYHELSQNTLSAIKHNSGLIREHLQERIGFEERNWKRWEEGFILLEIFIGVCSELGEEYSNWYFSEGARVNDYLFEAMRTLHARACLIAREIYALMLAGFADGAMARWRSLHEVSVTAIFVANGGQELAEKYLLHEQIMRHKWMMQWNLQCEKLKQEPLGKEDVRESHRFVEAIRAKYGEAFCKSPYGWALDDVASANFAELEKQVGLEFMRPYYLWANQKVHSGHKSYYADLGLSEASEYMLLIGQSNSGMTDPAHCTSLSLMKTTSTFLLLMPEPESVIFSEMLMALEEEIGEVFVRIQNQPQAD